MLFGMTPFYNQNQRKLLKKIKTAKVLFPDKNKFKIEYSDEIMDLILKLLEKDRSKRLGSATGAKEILSHPKKSLTTKEQTPYGSHTYKSNHHKKMLTGKISA